MNTINLDDLNLCLLCEEQPPAPGATDLCADCRAQLAIDEGEPEEDCGAYDYHYDEKET